MKIIIKRKILQVIIIQVGDSKYLQVQQMLFLIIKLKKRKIFLIILFTIEETINIIKIPMIIKIIKLEKMLVKIKMIKASLDIDMEDIYEEMKIKKLSKMNKKLIMKKKTKKIFLLQ